jgi:hypothetical protein
LFVPAALLQHSRNVTGATKVNDSQSRKDNAERYENRRGNDAMLWTP